MASTTLVTFLFESPRVARSVELLGSWDNWTKAYRMQLDKRRGSRYWTGCYRFSNIICDGDPTQLSPGREGGLRTGGTYWYYYRVDDEDTFNPSEPSTSLCPMMPGQTMNVLEVPMQARSRSSSSSSTSSRNMTMDPNDKFLNPRPAPVPKSQLTLPRLTTSISAAEHQPDRSRTVTPISGSNPSSAVDRPRDVSTSATLPTQYRTQLIRPGALTAERRTKSADAAPTTAGLGIDLTAFKDVQPKQSANLLDISRGRRARHEETASSMSRDQAKMAKVEYAGSRARPAHEVDTPTIASQEWPAPAPLGSHPRGSAFASVSDFPCDPSVPGQPNQALRTRDGAEAEGIERLAPRSRSSSTRRRRGKSPYGVPAGTDERGFSRRSSSLPRTREPSPLRNSISINDDDLIDLKIPELIVERDEREERLQSTEQEDAALSVSSSTRDRPVSRKGPKLDTNLTATTLEVPMKSPAPRLDKDLPDLPADLMPAPLNIRRKQIPQLKPVQETESPFPSVLVPLEDNSKPTATPQPVARVTQNNLELSQKEISPELPPYVLTQHARSHFSAWSVSTAATAFIADPLSPTSPTIDAVLDLNSPSLSCQSVLSSALNTPSLLSDTSPVVHTSYFGSPGSGPHFLSRASAYETDPNFDYGRQIQLTSRFSEFSDVTVDDHVESKFQLQLPAIDTTSPLELNPSFSWDPLPVSPSKRNGTLFNFSLADFGSLSLTDPVKAEKPKDVTPKVELESKTRPEALKIEVESDMEEPREMDDKARDQIRAILSPLSPTFHHRKGSEELAHDLADELGYLGEVILPF